MKKVWHLISIAVLIIFLFAENTIAQSSKQHREMDSVVGWQFKFIIDPNPKPVNVGGKIISVKQQEILSNLIQWIQLSYIPVGGIGTFTKVVQLDKDAFPPHGFGLDLRVWNVSLDKQWLDAKGKFRPIPEEYTKFGIDVNAIPGSYPIYFINSPDLYLFTWPPQGYARNQQFQNIIKQFNLQSNPNISPFLTRVNEVATVFLAPNNKLPFTPVSKGEYLNYAYQAMDRVLLKEKEKVYYQWQDQKARDELMKERKDQIDRFRKFIDKLREKYKASLNEPAVLNNNQPTQNDFFGDIDPFEILPNQKNFNQAFPVYKLSPDVLAKCNSDKPQWISIWFPYYSKDLNNQQIELFTAMTENINYQYIYDYYFNPEAVKGKSYEPTNKEKMKRRLAAYAENRKK